MSGISDPNKLSAKEQRALEQYAREHSGSTLLKNERTAQFLQRERINERGEASVKPSDISRDTARTEKYGYADSTPPDLGARLSKLPSALTWDAPERFVRLSDCDLENFKTRYPAFMPEWFYRVSCGNDAEPNSNTRLLAWQAWRAVLTEAWHSSFHPEYVAQLLHIPTTPPGNTQFEVQRVCDAQRAVLAIALESWRARFCPRCGLPFVARKTADKYWPKACFEVQRREKQRASKRKRTRNRAKSSRRTKR
jgi:hypothetical protein